MNKENFHMLEEEIRGKLLLPYLNDLGIDLSQIKLEESFTIQLGKTKHLIKGRADILCKANGKNLFIIELKSDSINISQKDIDQGISYSRALIDEIAPFTLITNGKTTRIFDSISRKELTGTKISENSDFWKNDYTLSTDVELRIRYEALKNFVSLSPENLKLFCEKQVSDRMQSIVGSISSPTSKFVKDLFLSRDDLQSDFLRFLKSDAKVYGLVGAAGVGKTNAICSLALSHLEKQFVFFYNATIINKSPLDLISKDLNGEFSSKTESSTVLKKLDELGRFIDKDIIIFIDGIDECSNPKIYLELSEIALAVRNLERVKLCISCKSNIWSNVLEVKGSKTHLYEELCIFHKPNKNLNFNPGFLLNGFNDDELVKLIPIYRNAFGFKGEISLDLLKELRNGFFLRIFSEVYADQEVPSNIDDKELIKKYINKSLSITELGIQAGIRILAKIGKSLVNRNYTRLEADLDDSIDSIALLEELNFPFQEIFPEDLFSRNLLIRSNNKESETVNFYYSKIRDYIICFHSLKLDQLNNEQFYEIQEKLYQNHIGSSALDFYASNCSNLHKSVIIQFKKDKALQYVEAYDNYLDENFNKYKNLFDPKTVGKIGIIIPRDLIKGDGYAFCHLDENFENRVFQEDLTDPFSDLNRDDFMKMGVNTVYGTLKSFLIPDQSRKIKENLFKQLETLVKKGRLTTYDSDFLLFERLSLIVYFYFEQLGYGSKLNDFHIPRIDAIYPIDLNELKNRVYKLRAHYHFKLRMGLSSDRLLKEVQEAIEKNIEIPKLTFSGTIAIFEELFKIVDILLVRGYVKLDNHYLPVPDKKISDAKNLYDQDRAINLGFIRINQFSESRAKEYVESFFKQLEVCYKNFVDDNFPNFKNRFEFYNNCPHEYFFYLNSEQILKPGSFFGYRSSRTGKVEIHYSSISPKEAFYTEIAFNVDGLQVLMPFSFDKIISNSNQSQYEMAHPFDRLKTPKIDEFSILRNWVYKFLRKDLKLLFDEYKEP